jgi:hypothetical protein
MPCREQREQAIGAYAARALKKRQRNVKTLVVVTATLRTIEKLLEDYITALEHACRQQQVSTRSCKVCSGPRLEESVVAASGLAGPWRVRRNIFGAYHKRAKQSTIGFIQKVTSHQTRPKIAAGDASLLKGSTS